MKQIKFSRAFPAHAANRGSGRAIFGGLLLCSLLAFGVACQHARIRFDDCLHCREAEGQSTKVEPQIFWAWGLYPGPLEYNLSEICPTGVKEVHEYANWLQGLFDNGSSGIYAPRTLAVTCNTSAANAGDEGEAK